MQVFILSPNVYDIFTKEQINLLKSKYNVIIQDKIIPFHNVPYITKHKNKIIAVDPDFFNWQLPDTFLEIPGLKALVLQTTSYNWVNIEKAKKLGIKIFNDPGFATNSVAEWAIMMALIVARRLPLIQSDGWTNELTPYKGITLKGKTAGILGLGKIGTRIAELCSSFGMNVIYWSRKSRDSRFKYKKLPEVVSKSDFIFPAWATNLQTQELITKEEMLKHQKSTAIWTIIYGPHKTININYLLKIACEHKIYGLALESYLPKSTYKACGNVLILPDRAWYTKDALKQNAKNWIKNITQAVKLIE